MKLDEKKFCINEKSVLILVIYFLVYGFLIMKERDLFLSNNAIELIYLVIISLFYIITIIIVFKKDNIILNSFNLPDNNAFYESYLLMMFDSLEKVNIAIDNANSYNLCDEVDLTPCLKKIEGTYSYLKTIKPPKSYKYYHNQVLEELKNYIYSCK